MAALLMVGCREKKKDISSIKDVEFEEGLTLGLPTIIKTKDGREAHLVIPDSNRSNAVYCEQYNMTGRRNQGVLTIYYNGWGDSLYSVFDLCHVDTAYKD